MTHEQKDILFKDLCARLPYGIKTEIKYYDGTWELLAIYTNGTTYASRDIGYPIETWFEHCKPYLFPTSSMTEEQKEELNDIFDLDVEVAITHIKNDTPNFFTGLNRLNWFIKNHFDIYGLIPMGLANDATGKNIY